VEAAADRRKESARDGVGIGVGRLDADSQSQIARQLPRF
jgi:hypothetical protein